MSGTRVPANGWILYDGNCGVCTRWVTGFAGRLRQIGLEVAPVQSPWAAERTGIQTELLAQDIRLLHSDGRITSGAEVYRYVMRRIWWAYPAFLLSIAPGLNRIFDWCYRTFARHRTRISQTCGLSPQV